MRTLGGQGLVQRRSKQLPSTGIEHEGVPYGQSSSWQTRNLVALCQRRMRFAERGSR